MSVYKTVIGMLLVGMLAVHFYLEGAWKHDRWAFANVEDGLITLNHANGPPATDLMARPDLQPGAIVHFIAPATYEPNVLHDVDHGISVAARQLSRQVQICQWTETHTNPDSGFSLDKMNHCRGDNALPCIGLTLAVQVVWWCVTRLWTTPEYSYDRVWMTYTDYTASSSAAFHDPAYKNPEPASTQRDGRWSATQVNVGPFVLTPELLQISAGLVFDSFPLLLEKLSCADSGMGEKIVEKWGGECTLATDHESSRSLLKVTLPPHA